MCVCVCLEREFTESEMVLLGWFGGIALLQWNREKREREREREREVVDNQEGRCEDSIVKGIFVELASVNRDWAAMDSGSGTTGGGPSRPRPFGARWRSPVRGSAR